MKKCKNCGHTHIAHCVGYIKRNGEEGTRTERLADCCVDNCGCGAFVEDKK